MGGRGLFEKPLPPMLRYCLLETDATTHCTHLCHSALSDPRAKQSMRPGPQETAAGLSSIVPPRLSQLCQLPSYHLCHNALSVPFAKQSRRPDAHDATAGPEKMTPPKLSQADQEAWERRPFACSVVSA